MLKFEASKITGTQAAVLNTGTQAIPADFTRCEVRLLRPKTSKNNFFTPVVRTHHVLLLFPNSCAPAEANVGLTSSSAGGGSGSGGCKERTPALVSVTCEAQACMGHFLAQIDHIPFHLTYAAACGFSGCAVLVLECPDMEDVLNVLQVCSDVSLQGNDARTSSLYVKGFSCDAGEPIVADAALLASHYYIPTCPLCGDRLESTVSGYPPQTPLCTCARGGSGHECTCFLSSSCFVCRRFAESLERARQPQDPQQQQSSAPPAPTIKCEACAKAGDPWICLLCGYVGCSRYQAMHAKDHCVAHQHFFSMNLLTQQIWDYDGDCFVHRVVILFDTHTGNSTRMQFPGREDPLLEDGGGGGGGGAGGSGLTAGASDTPEAWKAEKKSISSKYDKNLISSHTQYALVIKSELDAKRAFYESQLLVDGSDTEEGDARVDGVEGGGGGAAAVGPFTNEEWEREAYFDLTKALEPVDSVLADVSARRRKVTAMFYAAKNLEMELELRASETSRLEKQAEGVKKELRSVIQQNVANDLRLSSGIHDLKETLQDIALNAETQRRLIARLGDNDVSRLVVMGGPGATPSLTSGSTTGSRKRGDKPSSKQPKK